MSKSPLPPFAPSETPEAYSVVLHCTADGADKIYKLSIEAAGDGWIANYANGRRGGTIKPAAIIASPVSYEEARKAVLDKLTSKLKGKYLPIEGSRLEGSMVAEVIETAERRASGVDCQLAIAIDEKEIERFLTDDRYVAQRKHNGERRPVILVGGKATGGNRLGQTVALSTVLRQAVETLEGDVTLDCEQVGDVLHAFDVLQVGERDLRPSSLDERLAILDGFGVGETVRITETARTTAEKRAMLAAVKAEGGEGLVFKLRTAPYEAGRVASWYKHKLWNSLSALVSGQKGGRRSVSIQVFASDSTPIQIGNVTIPSNYAVPAVGAVVEVRYLYAMRDGSLHQPVYEGERTDILPEACVESQRRYHGVTTVDDTDPTLALAS